jgi:hypothetical protein
MALQIKNNGPDEDEPAREYYGSSWTESTTAKTPEEREQEEPEFNPEQEFDTFKVPKGVDKEEKEVTSYMDPNFHRADPVVHPDDNSKLIKSIITVAIIGIIAILIKVLIFPAPKDLTDSARLSEDEIASKFKITFERDEIMDKYIPKWTNGTVEARSGKGLTVFSIDGKYGGFHIDNKKWSVYGLKIGMKYDEVPAALTFSNSENFMVLNDVIGGNSSADYYYNDATNEGLVVTINDNSGRVVAITYWNDFIKMTENLSY